jgi:hypothetical protein
LACAAGGQRIADVGDELRSGFWALSFGEVFIPFSKEGAPRRSNRCNATLTSAWRGRSDRIPVSYRFPDRFKYGLDVVMNDSILESNNLYSQSRQKCGTPSLLFCSKFSEMGRAVQLNGDAAVDAEKVDNVATYAELSPELLSQQASPLKVLP